jgi:hypothetical protein
VAALAAAIALALAAPARASIAVTAASPAEEAVLSWTDNGAGPYEVDRVTASAGVCDVGPPTVLTTTATPPYTDSPAPADGAYCYTVTSTSPADSGSVQVVIDNTPPDPPVVAAGSLRYVNGPPTLSWQASPSADVVSYSVVRDGSDPIGSTAGLSIEDTTAITDGLHTYQVVASDGLHDSQPAAISIFYDATPPDLVAGVTASPRASGVVDVSWDTPVDPGAAASSVGEVVVRRTARGVTATGPSAGVAICAVHPSQTTCADDSAAQGGAYRYSVFAIDLAANVSAPGTADVVEPDKTPPGVATGLAATRHGAAVTLRWTKAHDADLSQSVVVWRAGHAPSSIADGTRIYAGPASHVATTQVIGQQRFYAVFEVDTHGLISKAAVLAVTVPASKLRPIDGTIVKQVPTLSWRRVAHAKYYDVQIWLGSRKVAEAWPSRRSWTPPAAALAKGGRYIWYVWPGFGHRIDANYGPAIGHARFILRLP